MKSAFEKIKQKLEERKDYLLKEFVLETKAYGVKENALTRRNEEDYAIAIVDQVAEEYHKLEEQGLLLRLPCKVGGTIFVLDRDGQPREMILDAPDIRCHCVKEDNLCMALCDRKNTGVCAYRIKNDGSDIGKTVFLTKEEAEEALKKMQEGSDE